MTGSSDNIMPTCFIYSHFIYVTWNHTPTEDGYSFDYIEAPIGSSLDDIQNMIVAAGGDWNALKNEIIEVLS
ncbi:MAG: hypothetical protein PHC50_03400 [Candidatus Cloacimonetes bacterium]|nr:hypothetical protein [Candidatus Cloacimonadota bacterium]